jgi:CHASE2 domain-containing sensor protein
MYMSLRFLFLAAFFLGGCTEQKSEPPIDEDIILVNAGHSNRIELSNAINALSKCKPKVIAINFVFGQRKGDASDSLLYSSFKDASNVILVSLLKDQKVVSSDSLFNKAALAQGVQYYGLDDDSSVTDQMLYISVGDDLLWSFSTTIASYFDIDHSDVIMKSARGNRLYKIDYGSNFRIIDINEEFDHSLLKDKIVIVGYLGPEKEDMYSIPGGDKNYNTWILATCVRNILDGHFDLAD